MTIICLKNPVKFCLALLFAFAATVAHAQDGPAQADHIVFIENSWTDALKQAKTKNKYIFVDAYASWCGPCKTMRARTFSDSKAAEFFNKNFVNVAIDMEKGDGPQLAQLWQIQAYPTLIVFDTNGNPVSGSVGFINPNQLIRFGQQALGKRAMRLLTDHSK